MALRLTSLPPWWWNPGNVDVSGRPRKWIPRTRERHVRLLGKKLFCDAKCKLVLTTFSVESEDMQLEVERSLNLSMESLAMSKASAAWNKNKLKDILDHTGASKWSQLGILTNKTLVCILRDRVLHVPLLSLVGSAPITCAFYRPWLLFELLYTSDLASWLDYFTSTSETTLQKFSTTSD